MSKAAVSLSEYALEYKVSDIAAEVLNDDRFGKWAASAKYNKHHHFSGGLAQHTLEVFELSLRANEYLKCVEPKVLFLACLFHDCGKMWDYEIVETIVNRGGLKEAKWQSTTHKRLIHHISRSAVVWCKAVEKYPEYKSIEDDVLHAILAHHGQREFGSPVSPNTKLAWLLHLNDCLSARIDDVNRFDRIEND